MSARFFRTAFPQCPQLQARAVINQRKYFGSAQKYILFTRPYFGIYAEE